MECFEGEGRDVSQVGHRLSLSGTDFEEQRGAAREIRQTVHQPPEDRGPGRLGEQGFVGLEVPDLARQRDCLVTTDIGRVADDQVEGPEVEGRSEIGGDEVDSLVDAMSNGIAASDPDRSQREVGSDDPTGRKLGRQGDSQTPGAGADIEDSRRCGQSEIQGDLDQMLGLGSRDENPLVDVEIPAEELPLAQDVGDRLTRQSSLEQGLELLESTALELVVAVSQELGFGPPQRCGEQEIGLAWRGVERCSLEPRSGIEQRLIDLQLWACSAVCFMSSAWKWAESGSMRLSSSPSRMPGSLCTVRPIRWSVTRFWGKL